MLKKLNLIILFCLLTCGLFAQNNSLILNGAVYVTLNGGTSVTPIRLILAQPNASGISRPVANNGWIISEGEYNYVQWNLATSTGNYIIPYNYNSTDIPFSMNITGAGVAGSSVLFSTYHTTASDNLSIPTYNGATTIPNINNVSGANNSAKMLDRWWIVDATSGYTTKPAATMIFSYIDIEHSVATNSIAEANLQAQSYNTSTSNWMVADLFGTDVPASNYVNNAVVPAAKLFRSWVLVDKTSPLPVDLFSFTAKCVALSIQLDWSTASETNNSHYVIEKSFDAQQWFEVAKVTGAGNINELKKYQYFDNADLYNKDIYYRLTQVDYDGTSKEFNAVSAICPDNMNQESYSVYPNPAKDALYISIQSAKSNIGVFTLTNELGQKIDITNFVLDKGSNEIIINTTNLASGVYYISIMSDNNVYPVKRFVISR